MTPVKLSGQPKRQRQTWNIATTLRVLCICWGSYLLYPRYLVYFCVVLAITSLAKVDRSQSISIACFSPHMFLFARMSQGYHADDPHWRDRDPHFLSAVAGSLLMMMGRKVIETALPWLR
ncbi:hypothetical protein K431DRAFT_283707 [Polychaeton citri CBS 116435]|uniref:Uncharacterized protein n=1 Tax=Polychaeton citri CBS 116435 TaxID=1314669 RepID=A0A9P4Q8J0_9PEZI|nr:hypothetical protein K431DRAFT_283707 [Polychaeton citri CBS 116435]